LLIDSKGSFILAKVPGSKSPSGFSALALNKSVLVLISIAGSIAYTVAFISLLLPATVKSNFDPTLTRLAYFSGTEKSILTGLMLTRLAISVVGLIYAPTEMLLNPIFPENAALISVLES